MQPGDTVGSLPNTPLTTGQLDDLTESDRIELTIPIITFFDNSRGVDVVHQFVLRFKTVGYVLQYADGRGWVVQERAGEDEDEYGNGGESPYDGLTEKLLFLAQMKGQQLPDDDSEIRAEE